MKGRSVILIAHRLSTVEKADKIEGIYRSLVQRQMIGGGGNGNNNGGDIIIGGDPTTSANIGVEEGGEENNNKNLNDGRDSITSLASGGGGRRRSRIGPRIVGSSGLSISPRTMAQTLMATSFTHSTSSLQSK
ncbi:unnamed protein product [Meloidogyne enterolobii]|uniref:Uncharacterized protein n=1 Tax=Meloidogyne enterolobii TaxID=390850 RepID=A0ACB1AJ82_MELEN